MGIYDTQTTLELILDKSTLASTAKNIASGFDDAFKGMGETFSKAKGGETRGIYDYQGPGAGVAEGAGKIAGGLKGASGGVEKILKGPILSALGPIAVLAMIMSEILQFLRPFIKMFSLFMLILYIPVFRLLKGFLKDLPSKMDAFKGAQGEMGGGLGGVVVMIIDFLGGILTSVIDMLMGLDWNAIIISLGEMFIKIGSSLWELAGTMLGALGTWVDNLEPGVVKSVLENLVGALETGKEIIEKFFTGEETLFDTIEASLDKVAEWMGVGGLWETIKNNVAWFNRTMFGESGHGGLWGDITKVLGDVKKGLDDSWTTIIDRLMKAGESIKGAIDYIDGLWGAITSWFPNDNNPTDTAQDFISRDGKVQKFSSLDTIIGMKDLSGLFKGNTGSTFDYRPTYHIAASVDKNELRKIFDEHDEKVKRDYESSVSYSTNLMG